MSLQNLVKNLDCLSGGVWVGGAKISKVRNNEWCLWFHLIQEPQSITDRSVDDKQQSPEVKLLAVCEILMNELGTSYE